MNKTILIGHGSGGLMTSDLIRDIFAKHFRSPALDMMGDATTIKAGNSQLAFTTDSFVVDPIFFPGGNIGKLAVCGTINDLSVSGAIPLFLSSAFIIEEGFSVSELEEIVMSMAAEAHKAGVEIITGDTKVVKKGQCDKLFINTTGIGILKNGMPNFSVPSLIKPGDKILVNGYLGDHEISILSAREDLKFESPVISDVTSLNSIINSVLEQDINVHFMRDITRGGLATILAEITNSADFGIEIEEKLIPVHEQVAGICEIYGFNSLYLANEGKVLMIVSSEHAEKALHILQEHETGKDSRIIGEVTSANSGKVLMKSIIGGTRLIDKIAGEQLPRIC